MSPTAMVDVTYSQLAVFASALQHPLNDWTDEHVAQGFAWRPGSVSFRTLVESGPHAIEINVAECAGSLHPDTVRAIEVPFEVPADGAIEIGSISDSVLLSLKPGLLLLRCEFLGHTGDIRQHVRLTFSTKDIVRFAIVRADEALTPDRNLLESAEAAIG